jgi:hypothetical protein
MVGVTKANRKIDPEGTSDRLRRAEARRALAEVTAAAVTRRVRLQPDATGLRSRGNADGGTSAPFSHVATGNAIAARAVPA